MAQVNVRGRSRQMLSCSSQQYTIYNTVVGIIWLKPAQINVIPEAVLMEWRLMSDFIAWYFLIDRDVENGRNATLHFA